MINEVLEATEYLEGKNIKKNNLYRICYMITKLFYERGMDKIEIRDAVFAWAARNYIHIDFSVNKVIYHVNESKRKLRGDVTVRVSAEDVHEINRRFDDKKTKKVALAILCYAKVASDGDGEFQISNVALGAWVGIDNTSIGRKYIPELCDFGYITKVDHTHGKGRWRKGTIKTSASPRYKINVPIGEDGHWELRDNQIDLLYRKIFSD